MLYAGITYKLDEEESVDVLKVDNTEVRKKQIEKLQRLRANRDRNNFV